VRTVLTLLIAATLLAPVSAAPLHSSDVVSPEAALRWVYAYRTKPDVDAVPAVFRSLSQWGTLRDPEAAAVYVGFLAGVLGSNPAKARALVAKILPLPFEDQWVVIKAVAFSDLAEWKDLLRELTVQLPDRQLLIERYLTGKLPTLAQVAVERKGPTAWQKFRGETWDKVSGVFKKSEPEAAPQLTFESSPDLIDTLWGLHFATGNSAPIVRLIALLPWSKDRDSLEKLTVGSMAKYTLAMNASRDLKLLSLLKQRKPSEAEAVVPVLAEVIDAAETVNMGRLRKDALAAVEELRLKGPGSKRDVAWWAQVGEGAISLGCIGAAAAGQVALGLPCVVGGALSSAGLRYLGQPN
jgi:hypothetical protein